MDFFFKLGQAESFLAGGGFQDCIAL